MDNRVEIEAIDEREFLVEIESDGDTAQIQFIVDTDDLVALGLTAAGAHRVVEYAMNYLIRRQPIIDLPHLIYIEDITASYSDFIDSAKKELLQSP